MREDQHVQVTDDDDAIKRCQQGDIEGLATLIRRYEMDALRLAYLLTGDRYLAEGTMDDLRREEDVVGYAARLRHGEIGKGMNDYDAIFSTLKCAGFDGWISIEDGVDGVDQLRRSVTYLRDNIARHWNG